MLKLLIAAAGFIALGLTFSSAQSNSERYDKEMAKYEKTNTFKNCIRASQIRRTNVLDDNHILFELRNRQVMLNTLDHKCSRLGFERSITYKVRNNQLCSTDIVSVFDSTFGATGGCFLGKFEVLEKLPADSD